MYDFAKCILKKERRTVYREGKKTSHRNQLNHFDFFAAKISIAGQKNTLSFIHSSIFSERHIYEKKTTQKENIIGIPLINGASALCTNGWIYMLMIGMFRCLLRFLTSSYGQWSNLPRFIFSLSSYKKKLIENSQESQVN